MPTGHVLRWHLVKSKWERVEANEQGYLLAHHDASHSDEWCGSETPLLSTQ